MQLDVFFLIHFPSLKLKIGGMGKDVAQIRCFGELSMTNFCFKYIDTISYTTPETIGHCDTLGLDFLP